MSVITQVFGYIIQDYRSIVHNRNVVQNVEEKLDIFCMPKYRGDSDYILFAADYNYLSFDEWLDKFESVLKKLKAYKAVLFASNELGKVFAIYYDLYEELKKEQVNLGYAEQHSCDSMPMLIKVFKRVPAFQMKEKLENDEVTKKWELLGNIPVDDDGNIQEPFEHFPVGTDREDIWSWFESTYNVSVAKLMFPKKKRLGRVFVNPSYVVDLDNQEMVDDAKQCLFEDLMNAVKYDELFSWIEVKEDTEADEKDIPTFLISEEE